MAASRPRAIDSSEVIGIPEGLKIRTRPATAKEKAAERQKSISREQRRDTQAQRDYAGDRDREASGRDMEYGRERDQRGTGTTAGTRAERGTMAGTGTMAEGGRRGTRRRGRTGHLVGGNQATTRATRTARGTTPAAMGTPWSLQWHRRRHSGPRPRALAAGGPAEGAAVQSRALGFISRKGRRPRSRRRFLPWPRALSADDIKECAFELLVGVAGCRGPALPKSSSFLIARPSKGIVSQEMKAVLDLKPQPPATGPRTEEPQTTPTSTPRPHKAPAGDP